MKTQRGKNTKQTFWEKNRGKAWKRFLAIASPLICRWQSLAVSKCILSEAALRENEERYRLLFNSGNDAVFVHGWTDAELPDAFLEVNDIACERLGYMREELLNLTLIDVTKDLKVQEANQRIKALRRNKTSLLEAIHVAKDGREIPVEINARMFEFKGRSIILSVARDVSQRKEAA